MAEAEMDLGATTCPRRVDLPHMRREGTPATVPATTRVIPRNGIIFLEISTHSNSPLLQRRH